MHINIIEKRCPLWIDHGNLFNPINKESCNVKNYDEIRQIPVVSQDGWFHSFRAVFLEVLLAGLRPQY